MLVRIVTKNTISIIRATACEAVKIYRVAMRAGYQCEVSADWQSNVALQATNDGYDFAAQYDAIIIPEDEAKAKAEGYHPTKVITL